MKILLNYSLIPLVVVCVQLYFFYYQNFMPPMDEYPSSAIGLLYGQKKEFSKSKKENKCEMHENIQKLERERILY